MWKAFSSMPLYALCAWVCHCISKLFMVDVKARYYIQSCWWWWKGCLSAFTTSKNYTYHIHTYSAVPTIFKRTWSSKQRRGKKLQQQFKNKQCPHDDLHFSTWLTCKNSENPLLQYGNVAVWVTRLHCFQSAIIEISTTALQSRGASSWIGSSAGHPHRRRRPDSTGSVFSSLGFIRSSSNREHNQIIGDSPTNREKKTWAMSHDVV